ncbi:cobalt transport protein [Clostridiales bacterium oral taxon 876 str. F0540]|nr:cobalt transport protein [Clostridiales bacterium oral taxon 876 str. F0540]
MSQLNTLLRCYDIIINGGEEVGEWLFKEDEYTPKEDKDKFVDKSTFTILKILSNIKKQDYIIKKGQFYSLNPMFKLFFTIGILIFISLSKNSQFIVLALFSALVYLIFLDRKDVKTIVKLSLILPVFTLIMLLPSIMLGNISNSLKIILKVFTSILLINVLSYSTKWSEITKALKVFFVPDIFIFVLDITIRYIYVLGESALEMLYALKLKSIGRNPKKYNSLSGILGNLFLKSKETGEEMYAAMECRGFTGEYSYSSKFRISYKDILYCIYNIALIAAYFII